MASRQRVDVGAEDFMRVAEPFRAELLAHCYRMLGSVHDAEDLVQETYVRAWRAYGRFEGRSSLRRWLYRIATTACLRALEQRGRRPLPAGLGTPSDDPGQELTTESDLSWLQPLPDALFDPSRGDPAAVAVTRESVRLAFVAALQHLPARQRAVLILRDVLRWRAAEVADLLQTSTAAVNSALQRARAQMADVRRAEDLLVEPSEPERQALLRGFVSAFESADIERLVRLLRDDVVLEMPPHSTWYTGREHCCGFLRPRLGEPGDLRLLPTGANGQPAYGIYRREPDGRYRGYAVIVLTLTAAGIGRLTAFLDPDLIRTFDLPTALQPLSEPAVEGAS
jgi:RNA polymerase sigma-70 factor (ECF subfamily)